MNIVIRKIVHHMVGHCDCCGGYRSLMYIQNDHNRLILSMFVMVMRIVMVVLVRMCNLLVGMLMSVLLMRVL